MDKDRDEIESVAHKVWTERAERVGIFEQTDSGLAKTRANFVLLDEIREARDQSKGALKKSIREALTAGAGQGVWVIAAGVAVIVGNLIWKALR